MLVQPHTIYVDGGGSPTRRGIDVRSPGEVAKGAIPGAVSLPILDDEERHAVGLRYAEQGQQAAIEEGARLTDAVMAERSAAWRAAADERPSAFFCWRGGLRSELAQRNADRPDTPRVEGGYKAIRAHLTASLPRSLARRSPMVVTGATGTGKTELLSAAAGLDDLLALDLEAAAHHRGSSFGSLGPQPAQATFEHRLSIPLLLGRERHLLLEDESRNIGRVHLPAELHATVRSAPLLVLEDSLAGRVARIHRSYVVEPARERGVDAVVDDLAASIRRLRKRLGTDATERMVAALEDARDQDAWDDPAAARAWIEPLLTDYYDPAYRASTPLEGRTVLARGDREDLLAWLNETTHLSPV